MVEGKAGARNILVEDVIDAIMIPPNNKDPNAGQLPGPVPLVQRIDVLVDMWEAEGLY